MNRLVKAQRRQAVRAVQTLLGAPSEGEATGSWQAGAAGDLSAAATADACQAQAFSPQDGVVARGRGCAAGHAAESASRHRPVAYRAQHGCRAGPAARQGPLHAPSFQVDRRGFGPTAGRAALLALLAVECTCHPAPAGRDAARLRPDRARVRARHAHERTRRAQGLCGAVSAAVGDVRVESLLALVSIRCASRRGRCGVAERTDCASC